MPGHMGCWFEQAWHAGGPAGTVWIPAHRVCRQFHCLHTGDVVCKALPWLCHFDLESAAARVALQSLGNLRGGYGTIPGVKVATNLAEGTQLTSVGTVDGFFKAIATSQSGTRKAFSFTWEGTQWPDGKDAVATDDDTIQLTMKVIKGKTPETEKPSKPGSNVVPGGTDKPGDMKKSVDKAAKGKAMPQTGEANYALAAGIVAVVALAILAFAIVRRRNKR